jgi:hypothetical protein
MDAVVLCVPTKQVGGFPTFNVSNVSRLSCKQNLQISEFFQMTYFLPRGYVFLRLILLSSWFQSHHLCVIYIVFVSNI